MAKNSKNCIICDKSMKMVATIMKLSPFSGAPLPFTKQVSSFASSVKVSSSPPTPQFHKNHRAREMKTTCSKQAAASCVVPIEGTASGNGNLRVFCEERVDSEAWDFIRKVHERNRSVLNEA